MKKKLYKGPSVSSLIVQLNKKELEIYDGRVAIQEK